MYENKDQVKGFKETFFKTKIFKVTVSAIAVLIFLFVFYLVAFSLFVTPDRVKMRCQYCLSYWLNNKVYIQNASMSPFGKITLENVIIKSKNNPEQYISAKLVNVNICLLKMLAKNAEVKNINISGVTGTYYLKSDRVLVSLNNKINKAFEKVTDSGIKKFSVSNVYGDDINCTFKLQKKDLVLSRGHFKINPFKSSKKVFAGRAVFNLSIDQYADKGSFLFEYNLNNNEVKVDNIYINEIGADGSGKIIFFKNNNIFYEFSLAYPAVKDIAVPFKLPANLGFKREINKNNDTFLLLKKKA